MENIHFIYLYNRWSFMLQSKENTSFECPSSENPTDYLHISTSYIAGGKF